MAVRIGRQTPTQAVILPYRFSKGREAVKLYEQSGRKAQPWQVSLLRDIMSLTADQLWTHTKFGYSLPRRNGKNEVVVMREVWGLAHGEQICHTAHRTTTSHAAWERLCRVLGEAGYEELGRKTKNEIPPAKSFRTCKRHGLETIELTNGGRICFRTRTESGGLGEGYDLLIIDEAQEYTAAQESALIYTVSDSRNPQTILCGTPPTTVSAGTVFVDMRNDALAGRTEDVGWAEWGVTEEPKNVRDVELWYETNPSLGSILTERKIRGEIRGDTLDFVIQRLGYWYSYTLSSAITKAEWEAMAVPELPELKGKLCVGIKYAKKLPNVSMAVAVRTWDDKIFTEVIDCRPVRDGDSWILSFLSKADVAQVVADGAASQHLAEEMRQMGLNAPLLPKVADVIEANALLEQMMSDGKLCHCNQASLTDSASNCEHRPIGTAGGFGYQSIRDEIDVSLLESVILAAWSCSKQSERRRQRVTY